MMQSQQHLNRKEIAALFGLSSTLVGLGGLAVESAMQNGATALDWDAELQCSWQAVVSVVFCGVCAAASVFVIFPSAPPTTPTTGTDTAKLEASAKDDAELISPEQMLHAIRKRRSIFPKDYTPGKGVQITKEGLDMMLEAARWAPTHKRCEPWRFVVLSGDARFNVQRITLLANSENPAMSADEFKDMEEWYPKDWQDRWSKCEYMIAICMLRDGRNEGKPVLPEWEEVGAVSCAVHNMHLVASTLRYGSYWSSWNIAGRDSSHMKEFLGLKPADRCLGFFLVGSSDRMGQYRSGRKSVDVISANLGDDAGNSAGVAVPRWQYMQ